MKAFNISAVTLLCFCSHFSVNVAYSPQAQAADNNLDGVSNSAPATKYYGRFCENLLGTDSDPHAVHGIELNSEKGFAVVGKYNANNSYSGGFIVVSPSLPNSYDNGNHLTVGNTAVWKKTFGTKGVNSEAFANGANMVVELGSHLYVVGYMASTTSRVDAVLRKYNTSNGDLIWSFKFNDGLATRKTSAFEGIQISDDGTGLILSGLVHASNASCLEGFKSYGNPACGKAALMYFSSTSLNSSSPPSAPTWVMIYSNYVSGKNVRPAGMNGGYVTVASNLNEVSSVIRTNSQGGVVWAKSYSTFGEVTDAAVVTSGGNKYIMISGHGGNNGEIYGRLAKINFNDGSLVWAKSYGGVIGGKAQFEGITNGNPNNWIYHECWAITPTSDGQAVVLACGTGIEGCGGNTACNQDKRVVWRSYIFSASVEQGNVLWQRLDNYNDVNVNNVEESASEFIVRTRDGGFFSTNDEGCGVGVFRLEPPSNGNNPTPPTSPVTDPPTKSPVKSPTPPTSNCNDSSTFRLTVNGVKKSCSQLKKWQCKKWDRPTGRLVKNYCVNLCDMCDNPRRCKNDWVSLIDPESLQAFTCGEIPSSYCWALDKKRRRVREFCRGKCKFCQSKRIISDSNEEDISPWKNIFGS
jgi:hypothetical protein